MDGDISYWEKQQLMDLQKNTEMLLKMHPKAYIWAQTETHTDTHKL